MNKLVRNVERRWPLYIAARCGMADCNGHPVVTECHCLCTTECASRANIRNPYDDDKVNSHVRSIMACLLTVLAVGQHWL